MNTLERINDNTALCKIHKGQLHKLQQQIQETQQQGITVFI